MKVAGFTFIRNAIRYDFPVVEAISSVLPLCDAFFVAVGDSDDDTLKLVQSIDPAKIRIIETTWDPNRNQGGNVYADETNKAFDFIPAEYVWCFYIQGDEAIHEQDYPAIRDAMSLYANRPEVEGLLFGYKHFYGTFDYVADSRKWYRREVRVIRNDKKIRSYRDAQGFRKKGNKIRVKHVQATVYHYGWVRHPRFMQDKIDEVRKYYDGPLKNDLIEQIKKDEFSYERSYDSLARYKGSHPAIMKSRIDRLNWEVDIQTDEKNLRLKYRLLYWFERVTGIRLFEFRNFRILRD